MSMEHCCNNIHSNQSKTCLSATLSVTSPYYIERFISYFSENTEFPLEECQFDAVQGNGSCSL